MLNVEETMKIAFCIMLALTIYSLSMNHIMNNLIIIEVIIVTSMFLLFTMFTMMKIENYLILYFIILVICESMLGLSLMIALIRTHSNDYIKSMNMMKF